MSLGPDAVRYLHLANGVKVARPFHLRWLLPKLCGTEVAAWRAVRLGSWPVLAGAAFWWAHNNGFGWQAAITVAVLLLALPGITGPDAVNPVGVDLPATAIGLVAAALFDAGHPAAIVAAFICVIAAAAIKETTPIWVALWCWSLIPLAALAAPAARWCWVRWRHLEGPDPLGGQFQQIADHPIRAGIAAHRNWRNALIMVAPWQVTLIALYQPTWQVVVALAVAYAQLLVATDTVRLVQHAAGPVMAAAAVTHLPTDWLLVAAVAHVFWFYRVEKV